MKDRYFTGNFVSYRKMESPTLSRDMRRRGWPSILPCSTSAPLATHTEIRRNAEPEAGLKIIFLRRRGIPGHGLAVEIGFVARLDERSVSFMLSAGDDVRWIVRGFERSPVEDLDRRRPAFLHGLEKINIEEPAQLVLGIKQFPAVLVVNAEDVEARVEVEIQAVQGVELGRDR